MKRIWLLLLVPSILGLAVFYWVWHQPVHPVIAQRLSDGEIVMLPSTIPIDLVLQQRVLWTLSADEEIRRLGIKHFSITNVFTKGGYHQVSVAGLPETSERMVLADAIWLGMVTLPEDQSLPGMVFPLINPAKQVTENSTGKGGAANILPFRTTAVYGELGVHDCGFGLNGWNAVDLFPSENMIYASAGGEVSYVCRDTHQVALRIGNNLYDHLVDTGQQTSDSYSQGQALGALVPGSYNDTCGYADQLPEAYHVHFCFVAGLDRIFTADGYHLNVSDTNGWEKNGSYTTVGGTLTADWQAAGITPGPALGSNFWDSYVGGLITLIDNNIKVVPQHQEMGIADRVRAVVQPAFSLLYVLILSNFDMTIPLWVIGIWFAMEAARIIYAGYMLVKKAIPVIG